MDPTQTLRPSGRKHCLDWANEDMEDFRLNPEPLYAVLRLAGARVTEVEPKLWPVPRSGPGSGQSIAILAVELPGFDSVLPATAGSGNSRKPAFCSRSSGFRTLEPPHESEDTKDSCHMQLECNPPTRCPFLGL